MTRVDSNVLIDVLVGDRVWLGWSVEAMDRSAAQGPLFPRVTLITPES